MKFRCIEGFGVTNVNQGIFKVDKGTIWKLQTKLNEASHKLIQIDKEENPVGFFLAWIPNDCLKKYFEKIEENQEFEMNKAKDEAIYVNAEITHSKLGYDEHGIFTFYISLKMENGQIGFGNMALDEYSKRTEKRIGTELGFNVIMKILDIAGVDYWEELKGKFIRVNKVGLGESINVIGHLIKDEWFNVKDIKANFN